MTCIAVNAIDAICNAGDDISAIPDRNPVIALLTGNRGSSHSTRSAI
jgi:hypothetical protein